MNEEEANLDVLNIAMITVLMMLTVLVLFFCFVAEKSVENGKANTNNKQLGT